MIAAALHAARMRGRAVWDKRLWYVACTVRHVGACWRLSKPHPLDCVLQTGGIDDVKKLPKGKLAHPKATLQCRFRRLVLCLQVGSELRAQVADLPINTISTYDSTKPELSISLQLPDDADQTGQTASVRPHVVGCCLRLVLFAGFCTCETCA